MRMPASFAGAVVALVPLLTLFFAWIHRLESLRWQCIIGSLVAPAGILIGVNGSYGETLHLPSMVIMVAGFTSLSESSVVYKLIPKSNLLATNALGSYSFLLMPISTFILVVILKGEQIITFIYLFGPVLSSRVDKFVRFTSHHGLLKSTVLKCPVIRR